MNKLLAFALMLTLIGSATAFDLGSKAPAKPYTSIPSAPATRQGGDTILDAVVITVPGYFTGSTVGFANDYDESCPYTDSISPDVVYTFMADADAALDLDMLGSAYDTKLYLYDSDLDLVACNDDFHPDYTSKLENIAVLGGETYFVVVDGYGENSGDYVLDIAAYDPCIIDCPAGWPVEGEPTLVNGYIDVFNGGCNTEGSTPFQRITYRIFCGVSGWYDESRDTDWFLYSIPAFGVLEVTGNAEFETYMFELGPHDCDGVAVIQNVIIGPCQEGTMTITGAGGADVWFWVGPTTFGDGVALEYQYILESNYDGGCTAVENHSLTSVKSLFD